MLSYEKKPEYRVFNYPVAINKILMSDFRQYLNRLSGYALFYHYKNVDGSEEERIEKTEDFFGVSLINTHMLQATYTKVIKMLPASFPYASIPVDMFFRLLKNADSLSEFETMVYACYTGLRSILGSKPYVKTTNDFMLARAFGFSTVAELKDENPALYLKYCTRRRLKRLKDYLEENLGVRILNDRALGLHGFVVSVSISHEAIARDLRYKIKERAQRKKEIQGCKKEAITYLKS